jgi:hypothetical protein
MNLGVMLSRKSEVIMNDSSSNDLDSDYRPTRYGSSDYDRKRNKEVSVETTNQSSRSSQTGNNMDQCIQDCLACYQECTSCIPHCLSQGGKHAEAKHITLMMECAEMCNMSATLMQLKGQFAYEHCQLCAKACDACAESCSSIDPNDSMMQKCAEMCRQCAESCRSMAH